MFLSFRFLRPGTLPVVLSAVCVVAAVASAQNPTDPQAAPKKEANDNVVRGCLEGSRLIERVSDYAGMTAAAMSNDAQAYRLRGPKSLLKELEKAHKGHVVEIVGTVRVPGRTQPPAQGGLKVGDKSSVFIRSGKTQGSNVGQIPGNELELVVKSFEVLGDPCRDR